MEIVETGTPPAADTPMGRVTFVRNDVPVALFGRDRGEAVAFALTIVLNVPPEELSKALGQLGFQDGIMPLIDPSAWLDGTRFRNTEAWRDILQKLGALRAALVNATNDGK